MVRDDERKYVRLAAILREGIATGEYPAGQPLPTVQKLREDHGCTVATVQEAMKILKREGLIDSSQGRRSRVLPKRQIIAHSASYVAPGDDGQRLTWKQQLKELGVEGGQILGRVGEVPAPEDIAERFDIAPGAPVLLRPRVMLADGEPVQIADSYYPLEIASGTPLAQQELVRGGAAAVFAQAGLEAVDCEEVLTFPLPGPVERERLQVEPDARIVRMVRTLYGLGGRALWVDDMTLKADRHQLVYRLPVHN